MAMTTANKRPTKILSAPYKVLAPDRIGRMRQRVMIDTDAGTLEFSALAEAVGIPENTLRTRLWRDGWRKPHVLAGKPEMPTAQDGPTRIIAKPRREICTRNSKGQGMSMLMFRCDDGNTYTLDELAKATGVNRQTIRTRLSRALGWRDPEIFLLGRKKKKEGEGNAEWRRLSDRPRTRNMAMVCRPGLCEK